MQGDIEGSKIDLLSAILNNPEGLMLKKAHRSIDSTMPTE